MNLTRYSWLARVTSPYLLVGFLGLIVWRMGVYLGDDRNTLFPVAQHSVEATIAYYIRPLEYLVVQMANAIYLPLWIAISVLCAVTASVIHVSTAQVLTGQRLSESVRPLAIAASPLWFYTISQVDTVSQSLCNLFFAAALYLLAKIVSTDDVERTPSLAAGINIAAAVLIYTKELAIGAAIVLPLAALVRVVQNRKYGIPYLLSGVLFLISLAAWILLKLSYKSMLPEASGHYNLTPGIREILQNTLAAFAFPLTPLPSSLLSFSYFRVAWVLTGVGMIAYFVRSTKAILLQQPRFSLFWLAFLGSCLPMFYIHASELYSSMFGTFLVTLILLSRYGAPLPKIAYCVALLTCSYVNAFLYFNSARFDFLSRDRTPYSIYYGPNGIYFGDSTIETYCPVRGTDSVAWNCGHLICGTSQLAGCGG